MEKVKDRPELDSFSIERVEQRLAPKEIQMKEYVSE